VRSIENHSVLAESVVTLGFISILAFYVIDTNNIFVFTREKIIRRQRSQRKRRETGIAAVAAAASAAASGSKEAVDPPPKDYSNFVNYRKIDVFKWIAPRENGTSSPPVAVVRVARNHCLIFAFEDGSVKVIQCDFISENEHQRSARLLCDFVAHPVCIVELAALDWLTCHGDAHLLEFVSTGSDNELRHWAVKTQSYTSADIFGPEFMGVSFLSLFLYALSIPIFFF
jgi:hypothetical protein